MTASNTLKESFVLPCGVEVPNRICKSALSENLADVGGKPSQLLLNLYKKWGQGGAGIIISGNVMVDPTALGEKKNVVIEDEQHLDLLKKWADVTQQKGTQLWMQINHPGRQAPKKVNKEVVSPSDVQLPQKSFFDKPRVLTPEEIATIIERYGNTALIAKKAGFAGVQIHGAHGYLVSQFLSPHTNKRTDDWGGSFEKRAKFVLEVYKNMRVKIGADYPVGIKLNSADFQRGGFTEEESLQVIELLTVEGIDMIEISGGTYEKAAMMGLAQKESTQQREAYFADFIIKARAKTNAPLMLTGGFRTFEVMAEAIRNNELDFIGLGRPFALQPNLVNEFFEGKIDKLEVKPIKVGLKGIDKLRALDTIWHAMQLERIGKGKEPKLNMSGWAAFGKLLKTTMF